LIHSNHLKNLIVIIDFKGHGEIEVYAGVLGAHFTLDDGLFGLSLSSGTVLPSTAAIGDNSN